MSSHNTTSSSIFDDALARLQPVAGLPLAAPTDAALGPAATATTHEKVVSIHPVPETAASAKPSESAPSTPLDSLLHDDADVQEYMTRLLKRSGSSQTADVAKPESTPAPPQPTLPMEEPSAKIWDAKEFIPKSVAPEKKANLTALREVANESQRSAIATSVKQKRQVESSKYWALMGATLAFGILFLFMSSKWFDTAMLFGIASFLFTLPLAWQANRVSDRKPKMQNEQARSLANTFSQLVAKLTLFCKTRLRK